MGTGVASNVRDQSSTVEAYMGHRYVRFMDDCWSTYDAAEYAVRMHDLAMRLGVVTISGAIRQDG